MPKSLLFLVVLPALFAVLLTSCGGAEDETDTMAEITRETSAGAGEDVAEAPATAPDATSEIAGVVRYPDPTSAAHNADLRYDFVDVPQHGGPHNPAWQNCGIYDEPVRPEHVIHSLEHGALWITYQPDLPDDQVAVLQDLVRNGDSHLLLSPYPNQRSPIFLTTWVYQLEVDNAADERVAAFIDRYVQDPQTTPEFGVTCQGQLGNPLP